MDTTGMINFWNNTIHLFSYEKISIYAWQDNSLKTAICSQKMSYHEEKIEQHIYIKTSFNKKYELLGIKNI